MTRRIAWAILLTAWTILISGGVATYFITRQMLLAEFDDSLVARARAVPQLLGVSAGPGRGAIPPGDRYLIKNEVGQVIDRSGGPIHLAPGPPPTVVTRTSVVLGDGQRLRTLTLQAVSIDADGKPAGPLTIVYSSPADRIDGILNRLAWAMLLIGATAGLATAWVAVRVARSALRPLTKTADTIGEIDERKLDRRIDAAGLPPELRPMAERLNQMLERLGHGFAQRKRFLADAAHELRTPIAALLTTLEVTLRRPRDAAALTEAMHGCLSETRMLKRLADALLEQARGEGPRPQANAVTDVSALLEECAGLAESLGREKCVKVTRSFAPGIAIATQPMRLQSIVANLLSNAVEASDTGGAVELLAERRSSPASLELVVRNGGKGIEPQHLPQIFEPFYRVGGTPDANGQHLGLGLFLVRSHVEALGGTCRVRSDPGKLTEFSISLPLTDDAPATSHNHLILAR
jgi:two-component system OmpR family sensor kinase